MAKVTLSDVSKEVTDFYEKYKIVDLCIIIALALIAIKILFNLSDFYYVFQSLIENFSLKAKFLKLLCYMVAAFFMYMAAFIFVPNWIITLWLFYRKNK